jgi:hypothetical protein
MVNHELPFEAVRLFCAQREVDLVLVEDVELAGGITVGGLMMTSDTAGAAQIAPKWAGIKDLYSGKLLVIRSADAEEWQTAQSHELFILVANRIVCFAGRDWLAPVDPPA